MHATHALLDILQTVLHTYQLLSTVLRMPILNISFSKAAKNVNEFILGGKNDH